VTSDSIVRAPLNFDGYLRPVRRGSSSIVHGEHRVVLGFTDGPMRSDFKVAIPVAASKATSL